MITIYSKSLEHTKFIADLLSKYIYKLNMPIFLYGDMGSGKTTFAKYLISKYCDISINDVISPTFPIICTYLTKENKEVYHMDLYRINSSLELLELNIDEIMHNYVTIIEWADKIPYKVENISIYYDIIDENTRKLTIKYNKDLENIFLYIKKVYEEKYI